jgi:hypothetical protein
MLDVCTNQMYIQVVKLNAPMSSGESIKTNASYLPFLQEFFQFFFG